MKKCLFAILLAMGFLFGNAIAFQPKCTKNSLGRIYCSGYTGGSIMLDSLGRIVCGKGECQKDSLGRIQCSKMPGGGVATDSLGRIVCAHGCERASSNMCVKATQ